MLSLALMMQVLPPPPLPPSFSPVPYPAQRREQVTTGACGRRTATVRIVHQAKPPGPWQQTVELTLDAKRIAGADAQRLNDAVAAFGAISFASIYCIEGDPVHVELHGPVSSRGGRASMIVAVDRGRITIR